MDMIEDSRGNLWFATWTAGVAMYNGRTFIQFDENKGLRSNYIWTIHEDKQGMDPGLHLIMVILLLGIAPKTA
jgi:ligand-binding sensor domain-containing protein